MKKNSSKAVRTRFAPSPSGEIHLGNLRAALVNYVWAKHHDGKFLIRIEDTDAATADFANVQSLLRTLGKFGLNHDEGPEKGGPCAPYFQSERTESYRNVLQTLIASELVYKCFCTPAELERERQLAAAAKLPPRYSRRCANLKTPAIEQKLAAGMPYLWRLRLNHLQQVTIDDLCKGQVTFGLSNFSDPALTRADGSFTFLFANFVDDWQMDITHVFRGEDHLSNTAVQLFMYSAFGIIPPRFGHLPIILNVDGHKLSKRERHAAAESLLIDGFLPSAVLDYLLRLGCFDHHPVRPLEELSRNFDIKSIAGSSTLRFDPMQLAWLNKEHIKNTSPSIILASLRQNLGKEALFLNQFSDQRLMELIDLCRDEVHTTVELLAMLGQIICGIGADLDQIKNIVGEFDLKAAADFIISLPASISSSEFALAVKGFSSDKGKMFKLIRLVLTGQPTGLGIEKLVAIYGVSSIKSRLTELFKS